MNNPQQLITDNLNIWTAAIKKRGSQGRGSSKKLELHGIKKLRELILELAVRGLLVPQNANDEPASVLLEKIAAEKAQLIKDGKIKTQKPLPEISEDEKPFELPKGWSFIRLGNLTSRLGSGSTPRGGKNAYVESGIPFLRSQNVWNDGLHLDDIAYIDEPTHEKMDNTKVFPGDVLLNITGASLGRSTIFPDSLTEANVSQHVTIIRLIESGLGRFVHLGIQSPIVQRLVWGRQVGMAIEGLSKKVLELFEFPIPPEAEQPRIVAKVDELMILCDKLEQQTEDSLTAHQTLVETLLNSLLDAAQTYPGHACDVSHDLDGELKDAGSSQKNKTNSDPFQQAWQRIWDNFDALFTTEHSIDQLKQTILQLAIMGKLVPQNENDEPASVLLEKIAAEKAQLIKDGKIKKQKPLPEITDEEKPFKLPKGWEWVRMGDLAEYQKGYAFKSKDYLDKGVMITKIQNLTENSNQSSVYIAPEKSSGFEQYILKERDIVMTTVGSWFSAPDSAVGRSFLINKIFEGSLLNQNAVRIRFWRELSSMYLFTCLNSSNFKKYLINEAQGTANQASITQASIKSYTLSIPPEAEQPRIVAKVDELMALCDTLKERIRESQTTQLHLADAMAEQTLNE